MRSLCIRESDYLNTDFGVLGDKGLTHLNLGCSYSLLSNYEAVKANIEANIEACNNTNLKIMLRPSPFKNGSGNYVDPSNSEHISNMASALKNICLESEIIGVSFDDFDYPSEFYNYLTRSEQTQSLCDFGDIMRGAVHDSDSSKYLGAFTTYTTGLAFEPEILSSHLDFMMPELYVDGRITRDRLWFESMLKNFINKVGGSTPIIPTAITYNDYTDKLPRATNEIMGDINACLKYTDKYGLFLWQNSPQGIFFPDSFLRKSVHRKTVNRKTN